MQTRHLLHTLLFLMMALLASLAVVLHFNGLYGQDAHEYLRQSRVIVGRLSGQTWLPEGLGEVDFAGGYPLAGAWLQMLGLEAIVAMQVVSVLSAGAVLWLFERLLRLLTPGTSQRSRLLYAALPLALSPMLLRAGLVSMSDALGLALTMAALWQGLRAMEPRQTSAVIWAAAFAVLAVTTRFALAALLLPMAAAVAWRVAKRGQWGWLAAAVVASVLACLPHFWLKNGIETSFLHHSLLQDWSVVHFLQNTFHTSSGTLHYTLPNGLYLLFPLAHPAFCLLLPGLFGLAKRTDTHLFSKKMLLACLAVYLLLLGGLPHQNLRYLLPAYVVLLLLMFPAWDRMVSYGFYFFPRLTHGILAAVVSVQLASAVFFFAPTLARCRLETALAAELRPLLPAGTILFAFDVDVALRSYLPDIQFKNLWQHRYERNDLADQLLLFNESALRQQWDRQNPMLNWEFAQQHFRVQPLRVLSGGWTLYRMEQPF